LEQQGRIVPANNRYRAGEASIRSSEEQDGSLHHSAHRGGLELSTGTGLYGVCRSTQCCLAVWSRWVESSSRLGGFRAPKKTTEAPYTTKVNYRSRTPAEPWTYPIITYNVTLSLNVRLDSLTRYLARSAKGAKPKSSPKWHTQPQEDLRTCCTCWPQPTRLFMGSERLLPLGPPGVGMDIVYCAVSWIDL
jgi:hypothetical protein